MRWAPDRKHVTAIALISPATHLEMQVRSIEVFHS
jgi:hypothetical protein